MSRPETTPRIDSEALFKRLSLGHRYLSRLHRKPSTLNAVDLLWRTFNRWADRALIDVDTLLEQEWVIDGHAASEEQAERFKDALEGLREEIALNEQSMMSPQPVTEAERAIHQVEHLMTCPDKAAGVLYMAEFVSVKALIDGRHADAHAWRTVASVARLVQGSQ